MLKLMNITASHPAKLAMKITLPTGGFADLTRTWTGNVHYSICFPFDQKNDPYLMQSSLMWLYQEGFFEQEMGKFEPDTQVTQLLKEI